MNFSPTKSLHMHKDNCRIQFHVKSRTPSDISSRPLPYVANQEKLTITEKILHLPTHPRVALHANPRIPVQIINSNCLKQPQWRPGSLKLPNNGNEQRNP